MNAGISPARPARARHRHELRTLTYVTLDQANGGVIRNLSREGIAVQVVAAVRPRQQLRVRFELRYPRLRVEARGEVMWATFSGQCGIRFLDVSPRLARQIDEWIFGHLLEGAPLHSALDWPTSERPALAGPKHAGLWPTTWAGVDEAGSLEAGSDEAGSETPRDDGRDNDGLMMSAAPVKVIELSPRAEPVEQRIDTRPPESAAAQLDWLSRPLSGRGLAWTVDLLAVVAGLLLFALIFLSVARELPRWPWATACGATVVVAALYWGFFKVFGGSSPGARLARLARLAGYDVEEEEAASGARFR